MKNTRKTLAVVLLAVLALSLCVPAAGAISTLEVPITYRNIKILLNGDELTPTDVNGDSTEPFIMDGSTYLPVRAVADAAGLEVEWDDETSTVSLTSVDDKDAKIIELQNQLAEAQGKQVVSMTPWTGEPEVLGYVIADGACSIFPYAETSSYYSDIFCQNYLLRADRRFLVKTADGEEEYWLLVSEYDGGQLGWGQFYPATRIEQVWIKESDVIPYTEETRSQLAYPVWVAEHTLDADGHEVEAGTYTIKRVRDSAAYITAPGGQGHWVSADEIIYPDLNVYGASYLNQLEDMQG